MLDPIPVPPLQVEGSLAATIPTPQLDAYRESLQDQVTAAESLIQNNPTLQYELEYAARSLRSRPL